MKSLLNLWAPVLALLTIGCALSGFALVWLLAAATLGVANWTVHAGARVLPAAVASAVTVMSLLWAYGAVAFMLILLAVVGVASLVRFDDHGKGP